MATQRRAISSASCSTGAGQPPGHQCALGGAGAVGEGLGTTRSPACSACRSQAEAGRPMTGRAASWSSTACTTAAACSSWVTIAL
jgi:hypothetical protein